MMSVGQPHRAIAATCRLCLAVASQISGSIPSRFLAELESPQELKLRHPSGILNVAAEVGQGNGERYAHYAALYRTARRLFQGEVLVPAATWPA
jgi:2-methylaconitate isomerase